jgi:flagellar motor switch protein FliG
MPPPTSSVPGSTPPIDAMKPEDHGIRKAAILVAALDTPAADAMLDQLAPEQAQRVRQAIVDLEQIDPGEQQKVIEEFFRAGPGLPRRYPAGVELDDSLARKLAMPRPAPERPSPPPQSGTRPFRFLHETEGEKLARVLSGERPQTVALVLSHLPPEQAGAVLVRLQPTQQADIVRRLVDLEETDPEILGEVERALQSRLSQQVQMQRRRVAGLKAVSGILEASGEQVAGRILDSLAAHDQPLAERLSPPPLSFDDLTRLDDDALAAVFRTVQPELAMTALIGAPPGLIDRVLRRSAASEAKTIRHKLNHPGPIRLSDVEGARQQVADLARRLAAQGRIRLPAEHSLAAA